VGIRKEKTSPGGAEEQAFSVSQSNAAAVLRYLTNQEEHHRKVSFQQELIAYLRRHGIEYDERYIWE
jgi:putative transposase